MCSTRALHPHLQERLDFNSFSLPLPSLPLIFCFFFGLEHIHVLFHTAGFAMEISIYKLLRFIVFFS